MLYEVITRLESDAVLTGCSGRAGLALGPYRAGYTLRAYWTFRALYRITSYNVCYTKLLRARVSETGPWQ